MDKGALKQPKTRPSGSLTYSFWRRVLRWPQRTMFISRHIKHPVTVGWRHFSSAAKARTYPSRGKFARATRFLNEKVNTPWKRRTLRVVRGGVIMGTFGMTCYSYGQSIVLDDLEGHQQGTYYNVLTASLCQGGCFLTFSDDDNLPMKSSKIGSRTGYVHYLETDPNKQNPYPVRKVKDTKEQNLFAESTRVQTVFRRVKHAALTLLEEEAVELERRGKEAPAEEREGLVQKFKDNLNSQKALKQSWTITVIENGSPNAFVHGLLPRCVFINQGLFHHFAKNEDELALVLGHELSHYLLRHTRDSAGHDAIVRGALLVLISTIDPSGGLGSLLLELLAPTIAKIVMMSNSREHECEADALGMRICAEACFDIKKSALMFENMATFSKEVDNRSKFSASHLLDSHPMSESRQKEALQHAATLLSNKYIYNKCAKKGMFYKRNL